MLVWRKGKEQTLTVSLGRLEAQEAKTARASPGGGKPGSAAVDELGVGLAGLDDELRQKYEIPSEINGVLITSVEPNGNAAEKQLKEGDIIVEVNQDPVASPDDIAAKIAAAVEAGKESVLLLVNSGGDRRFVVVSVKSG